MRTGRRGGRLTAAVGALLAGMLGACTSTPPPPVVSSPVAQTSTPSNVLPSQIVVSLDGIAGGYNPHTIADLSPVTSALSQMLLPSAFREDDEGAMRLDTTVMSSAEVVKDEPFTVAYEIRDDASWSDGAPIAVEDFSYLADAMRTQPGVVNPAGYRLISGIQPGEGGKRVEVTFSRPYPGWRTLFDNLLPAHLLKDAPGGWQGALGESFPAYGGPFAIKTVDSVRGQLILERNDRYWEKPAAVDQIVLRSSDHAGMADALRTGNDQLAVADTDPESPNPFADLGTSAETHTVPRPYLAELLLRPSGVLSDDQVRAAVAALLDRDRLIDAGADGGPSSTLRADAQVRPPSSDDYESTIPGAAPRHPAPKRAAQLLRAAGFEKLDGTWTRDGEPLTIGIASPGTKEPYARVAAELSDQLEHAGIAVKTAAPASRELFSNLLAKPIDPSSPSNWTKADPADEETTSATETPTNGGGEHDSRREPNDRTSSTSQTPTTSSEEPGDASEAQDGSDTLNSVDIAVVPQPISQDPASTLASLFGCPTSTTENTSGDGTGSDTESTAESGEGTGNESPGPTVPPEPRQPANSAAFCDETLREPIERAMSGQDPLAKTLSTVEPKLWAANTAVPLFQVADTLAVGETVSGVTPSGPSGLFSSAVNWTRARR